MKLLMLLISLRSEILGQEFAGDLFINGFVSTR